LVLEISKPRKESIVSDPVSEPLENYLRGVRRENLFSYVGVIWGIVGEKIKWTETLRADLARFKGFCVDTSHVGTLTTTLSARGGIGRLKQPFGFEFYNKV
jgi:hypothetical protein